MVRRPRPAARWRVAERNPTLPILGRARAGVNEGAAAPPRGRPALELLDLVTAPYDLLNWIADRIFVAAKALFDRYGAPVVFLSALAEATVGVGLIYPGVIMMFLGAAFADEQGTPIAWVFGLAIAGTILGDLLSYGLGRWGGSWVEGTRLGPHLRVGRSVVAGRARWLIPFYHLNSWTRTLGPFGAGALRLPLRVWAPLDFLGAVIANSAWVGAGWLLGRVVLTEDGTLEEHPLLRIGLGLGAAIWFVLAQREFVSSWQRAREEQAAGAAPAGDPGAG